MEWFFWLIFIPIGVVLVGHGAWVVIARILGRRVVTFRDGAALSRTFCPRCGQARLLSGICTACGWSKSRPSAHPAVDDLTLTAIQLTAFKNDGLIDAPTHDSVMSAIKAQRERAFHVPAMPPPLPIPVPPPIPVIPISTGEVAPAIPDVAMQAAPGVEGAGGEPAVAGATGDMVTEVAAPGEMALASAAPVEPYSVPEPATPMPAFAPPLPVTMNLSTGRMVPPLPVRPAPPPRRSLSEMFASFMEENNIRWGELIGGMLIIGCSTALVVSFWARITQQPWLQFSVFTAVTAAFFGLGLYTEHRWKLPTTSRGILLIATLLVPLNFLAFAALSTGTSPGTLTLAAEIVAFALFAYLVWEAAVVIAPIWPRLLTGGACAVSASLLLLGCVDIAHAPPLRFYLLALLPLIGYAAVTVLMLARARRWRAIHSHGAYAIFLLLGVVSFATVLAIALVIYRSGNAAMTLHRLALPLSLGGLPALATGMLLWRRVTGKTHGSIRAAGTTIAILGALILVAGIAVAWPDPRSMLPVAICDFVLLTGIALLYEIPAAHWLALPCAVIAWLVGFHLFHSDVEPNVSTERMIRLLLSPESGSALTPLTLLIAGAWGLLNRLRRPGDGKVYAWVGMITAALGVALVSVGAAVHASDEYHATWVYAAYAAAGFVLAWRLNRKAFSSIAWLLLTASLVKAFVAHRVTSRPWPDALLTAGTLTALAGILAPRFGRRAERLYGHNARWLRVAVPAVAVIIAMAGLSYATVDRTAISVAWAGALFLVVATVEENAALFLIAQTVLAAAVMLGVVARLERYAWFTHTGFPLRHPWTIQAEAIALAAIALIWKALRLSLRRLPYPAPAPPPIPIAATPPLPPPLPVSPGIVRRFAHRIAAAHVFDAALSAATLAVALALAIFAMIPALALELSAQAPWVFGAEQIAAIGAGAWILVAMVAILFILDWIESPRRLPVIAFMTTAWIACPLLAARMADQNAAASALRWLCGVYFLLGSLPQWARHILPRAPRSAGSPAIARPRNPAVLFVLILLGTCPIFLLSLWPTIAALSGQDIPGPLSSAFFARIGLTFSYIIPLLAIACVLAGDAIVERSQGLAFSSSMVICFTATLEYVLRMAVAHHRFGGGDLIHLLQINSLVLSLFAASWLAMGEMLGLISRLPGSVPDVLKLQVQISLAVNAVIIVPSATCLALAPMWAATFVGPAGAPLGFVALFAAVAAALLSGTVRRNQLTVSALALAALGLGAMAGLSFVHVRPGQGWEAFHALVTANSLAAWALIGFGWWIVRRASVGGVVRAVVVGTGAGTTGPAGTDASAASPNAGPVLNYQSTEEESVPQPVFFGGQDVQRAVIRSAYAVAHLVTLLAIRALMGDPAAPAWSIGAAVVMSLLCVTIACWGRRPDFLYPAGVLLNFAAASVFLYRGWNGGWSGLDFLAVQAIAAAIPGIAWLVLDLQVFRRAIMAGRKYPPFHHLAGIVAVFLALRVCWVIVGAALSAQAAHYDLLLIGGAILASAVMMVAAMWDRRARYALAGLYGLGLGALGLLTVRIGFSAPWLPWALITGLAGYALFTAVLFWRGYRVAKIVHGLGIPVYPMLADYWLPPMNLALAMFVIIAAGVGDFATMPPFARQIVASAALAQTLALGLLARRSRLPGMRVFSLWALVIGSILWGWAWLPAAEDDALHHCAIAFIVSAWLAHAGGLLPPRFLRLENPWRAAAMTTSDSLLRLGVVTLIATLAVEGFDRAHHLATRAHGVAIAVLLTILASCVLALITALRRNNVLSDRQRIGWVYIAEAMLAITFLHLRLSEPQLFSGMLRPYWPIVIMAIAFAGVGAAEMFRRQGRHILSEPLERTGIFLPLLPVLGWWISPAGAVSFGQLLLTVAAFYAILAAMQRSFRFAALAALAGNGALCDVLAHSQSLGFFHHPQLWLIPASLSVLAGAHLNRGRLTPERIGAIRYACLILIYVSSTAEIFLNGVDPAPWLPLVLAGLSVAGVLLGVMLRIRAFLFLGSSFLLLSVIAMIWFASSQFHWTWIWYVAGILLGTGILALFALFEKKREQMLALIEGLKQWE